MHELTYAVVITPLTEDDGGGFVATVPHLSGCMSDGETPEEARGNVRDAIEAWIATVHDLGHAIPEPSHIPIRAIA